MYTVRSFVGSWIDQHSLVVPIGTRTSPANSYLYPVDYSGGVGVWKLLERTLVAYAGAGLPCNSFAVRPT